MRILMLPMAALALIVVAPADAQGNHDKKGRGDKYEDVEQSGERLQDERQDVRDAKSYGTRNDVREEKFDVKLARQAYQQDNRDWKNNKKRARQEQRDNARDWQRGQNYTWNRPDPRYNGYYADNYYRAGAYRPYQLQPDDRIYRGNDNRYYCRRGDGTTGLIIGAIGGGVLGNAIAPGGSKTLGSILGGTLGAILGNSIGSGNVTCR